MTHIIHRSRKVLRAALVPLLFIAGAAFSAADPSSEKPGQAPTGFVGRDGTQFVLDGKPFFVAGVNNHYLPYGSDAEVTRVLDDAVAMNANVVRTFIQPVVGSRDGTSVPTIWNFFSTAETSNLGVNGTYMLYWDQDKSRMAVNDGEKGLERIDFLIREAAARNLKLVIAFLDFWPYTGGAQQMRAWYGSNDVYTFFAADPRTVRDYKDWVRHVITRVNVHTGIAYRDDPTIFAWELMNEPDIHPAALLRRWVSEMSAYVKTLDSKHLLATGHANIYQTFNDLDLDTIDFGTWHGYPIFNRISPARMTERIGTFCDVGRKSSKPMLLSEFGWARSNPDQVSVYENWLDTIYRDPNCAGWIVWRLVSRQDSGRFPEDQHDQFDVRRDGGALWTALSEQALRMRAKASPRAAAE